MALMLVKRGEIFSQSAKFEQIYQNRNTTTNQVGPMPKHLTATGMGPYLQAMCYSFVSEINLVFVI